MDQQKLRSLVFDKTGVRIDIDDPIFALVALNEAVLAEAVERHVALLDDATRALAEQSRALQDGGAVCRFAPHGADYAPPACAPVGSAVPDAASASATSTKANMPPAPAMASELRGIAIAGAAAVLGAVLVLLGQALWFKPAALPAPIVQARELTPEQSAALKNGEKLARIVQKLDPKTRNAVLADMQKP